MSQVINPRSDSERYKFLRDQFALHSENDEADFSKLARLTGSDFDAAIDAAIDESDILAAKFDELKNELGEV